MSNGHDLSKYIRFGLVHFGRLASSRGRRQRTFRLLLRVECQFSWQSAWLLHWERSRSSASFHLLTVVRFNDTCDAELPSKTCVTKESLQFFISGSR